MILWNISWKQAMRRIAVIIQYSLHQVGSISFGLFHSRASAGGAVTLDQRALLLLLRDWMLTLYQIPIHRRYNPHYNDVILTQCSSPLHLLTAPQRRRHTLTLQQSIRLQRLCHSSSTEHPIIALQLHNRSRWWCS